MEPARKSLKRKHYEVLKNDLGVELTKLTNDSRDLHNNLRSANKDFELMCKSMYERQADLLTRSLFIEENYADVIALLDGKPRKNDEESSGENEVLPTTYASTFHRFVTDSNQSLKNHCVLMEEEHKEMAMTFAKYEDMWTQNMKDLRERAGQMEAQRVKLSGKIVAFNRYVVEDSDTD